MDDRPTDVSRLAELDRGRSKDEYSILMAELAEQLDLQDYEAFWEQLESKTRFPSAQNSAKPK